MNKIDQINLNELSPSELKELNRRVVERLKYLGSVKMMHSMNRLHLGQRVCFETEYGTITGVLTKLNQKTVNVSGDDGTDWRVSPSLVKPVIENNNAQLKVVR